MPEPRKTVCHVETIRSPKLYTAEQVGRAFDIAFALGRGKFVLTEAPERHE